MRLLRDRTGPAMQTPNRSDLTETPAAPDALDPEWLSAVIGAIYDCVLDPSGWHDVIRTIADRFAFRSGVLGVVRIRQSVHEFQVACGIDEDWVSEFNRGGYLADSVALQGGADRVQSYPLDEPIVSSDILPASERRANRYYHDILEPRGLTDAILVGLARERQLIGYLGLNRHVSDGPIGSDEVAGVRLIAPHLRRAITIGDLFDLKAVARDTFRSVLDGMACAVVLVDDGLRIVHANPAAETMLASGNLLEDAKGRLTVRGPYAEEALLAAARIAAENEARLSQRGIAIPATARDGSTALLHVLPLARREVQGRLAQRAVAAVFAVPAGAAHAPVDAIAALYNFTPTESQIFASLCKGTSLATAADALGIAKSTARTHLLRIFAKTGCSRQAELVAMASRLSLNI